jgi:hypothetical protein
MGKEQDAKTLVLASHVFGIVLFEAIGRKPKSGT